MTHQFEVTVQPSEPIDFAEQRFTKEFLDGLADFDSDSGWDLNDYAKFYCTNRAAGYAFHKLKSVFEKIDMFLSIKPQKRYNTPWDYFSDVDALAKFSRKITELTETLKVSAEPLVVEKIRIVNRSATRAEMYKRIIDLEPSKRTFESDILEHLKDRHTILNAFLTAVNIERDREKASKDSKEGLRQRKPPKVTTEPSQHQGRTKTARNLLPHKSTHMDQKMERILHWPAWATFVKFLCCKSTILVLSILFITSGLVLSCQALYISVSDEADRGFSTANLFNTLGQNVLLGFSLYVLIVPFLRGVRLNNEKIWFIVWFAIGTFAGISSVVTFRWSPPVSTFLGSVANAAQILATLLLLQDEIKGPSVPMTVPGED